MYLLIRYLLLTFALAAPLVVQAKPSDTPANTSTLRVVCEKNGAGAEVTVNGILKGKCPITIKVMHGTLKLRVKKKVDALHERVFEKKISIGSGEVKKVTVKLSAPRLNSAEQRRTGKKQAVKRSKAVKHKPTRQAMTSKPKTDERAKTSNLDADEQVMIAKPKAEERGKALNPEVGKRVMAAKPIAEEQTIFAKPKADERAMTSNLDADEQAMTAKPIVDERVMAAKSIAGEQAMASNLKADEQAMTSNLNTNKRAKTAKSRIHEARKRTQSSAELAGSALQAGRIFRDCAGCPEMVVIAPGSFYMGSPSFEAKRQNVEDPVHHVTISGNFAMGKTEITRGQFAAFVNEANYSTGDKCGTFEDGKYEERSARNWRNPGYVQDDSHPVACINWMDAKAYTEWLSRKTGKQYRLPSEAEWEYAARGNSVVVRHQEYNPDKVCDYANVMDATGKTKVQGVAWEAHKCDDGYACTAPAGSFRPNGFGLNDMIGNVWEWVEDSNHNDYKGAPTDGSAWQGDGAKRVLRGGSWSDDAQGARAAARGKGEPALRNGTIGFRIARTLP